MQNPKVTVIGEALIDLVPGEAPLAYRATPGGSPYNVAIGLARLGQDTTLMARLADNAFGHILRDRAVAEGIDLDAAPSNGSGHAGGLFISRRVPYVAAVAGLRGSAPDGEEPTVERLRAALEANEAERIACVPADEDDFALLAKRVALLSELTSVLQAQADGHPGPASG